MPTCYAGAARIRALPDDHRFGEARSGEILLVLEISLEPKITWQRIVTQRIDKALDDKEQSLIESIDARPAGANFNGAQDGVVMLRAGAGRPIGMMAPASGMHQYFPARLKKGEKPSKALKELKGMLTAQIQTTPEPFITVENVLKAEGKTFKGQSGGTLQVQGVKKEEDLLTLRVHVDIPHDLLIDAAPAPRTGLGFTAIPLPPPKPPAPPPPPPPPQGANAARVQPRATGGLELIDSKGQVLVPVSSSISAKVTGDRITHDYVLTYRVEKDQVDTAKLVLSASRSLTIDIPYSLKDVPLP